MRTTKVTVLPYDSAWKTAFEEIRKEIEDVLDQISVRLGDILYEKYLILTPEEKIAEVLDRTNDTVNRLIKEGQAEVQRILDGKCGNLH